MTAHHFFADPSDIDDRTVRLRGDEAHHAAKSLRVRHGERITVADNTGRVVSAVVREVGDEVRADVVATERCAPQPPSVVLYQALTKSDKMDEVIERATELGVRRIAPFAAERSIVRWDAAKRERVRERWAAIARSAAKLGKSPWLTEIAAVSDVVEPREDLTIVLHEAAATRMQEVLPEVAPGSVGIVIGPEGGFTDDEVTLFAKSSHVVSLGPRILRAETAGIAAVAVIGTRYGTLG